MTRLTFALSLLLVAGAASAGRTLEIVENGTEASLADMTMPSSSAGTVIFKTCDTCDPKSLRVTSDTRYFIGDQQLPLDDFKRAVDRIRQEAGGDPQSIVGVYTERESGRVTRIKVLSR